MFPRPARRRVTRRDFLHVVLGGTSIALPLGLLACRQTIAAPVSSVPPTGTATTRAQATGTATARSPGTVSTRATPGTGGATPTTAQRPIALINGAVIDGTGTPRQVNTTVLLDGERIVAVERGVAVPAGATIVDLRGKTIIPGLIDAHGHFFARASGTLRAQFAAYPRLYLAGGVTTVRSVGELDPLGVFVLRERLRLGEEIGPRLVLAGPYFGFEGTTPDRALRDFAEWQGRIDLVKVYTRLTEDVFAPLAAAAHRAGLPVIGHRGALTAERAIALGLDGIEHGIFAIPEFLGAAVGGPAADCMLAALDLDGPAVERLITAIVARQVVVDPTIVIMQTQQPDFIPVAAEWERYLSPDAQAYQRQQRAQGPSPDPGRVSCLTRALDKQQQFVKRVHDRGGVVVCGTDPITPLVLPGYGLHRELRNLVDAGLTPLAALRAATADAARALRRDDEIGTIAPGKLADLVVIDGDPSLDITAIGRVDTVYQGGIAHDPASLRKSVEEAIV